MFTGADAIFCVSLHFTGTFFSLLVPSPRGPRQPGQFSDEAASDRTDISGIAKHIKVMIFRTMILPTPKVCVCFMLDECIIIYFSAFAGFLQAASRCNKFILENKLYRSCPSFTSLSYILFRVTFYRIRRREGLPYLYPAGSGGRNFPEIAGQRGRSGQFFSFFHVPCIQP